MSRDEQRRHAEAKQLTHLMADVLAVQIAFTVGGLSSIAHAPKSASDSGGKHDS